MLGLEEGRRYLSFVPGQVALVVRNAAGIRRRHHHAGLMSVVFEVRILGHLVERQLVLALIPRLRVVVAHLDLGFRLGVAIFYLLLI